MTDMQRVLARAGRRLFLVDLLRTGAVTTAFGLMALVAVRVFQKLVPTVDVVWAWVFAGVGVAALAGAFAWSMLRRSRAMDVARELDERAGLQETLSTALCVGRDDDAWSRVIVATAQERARRVVVRDAVPIEAPRRWPLVASSALALAVVWWLPGYDVTGLLAQEERQAAQEREIVAVRQEIRAEEQKIEALLKKAGVDFEQTGAEPDAFEPEQPTSPDEVRREAIKKLTNLAEQLEQMRADSEQGEQIDAIKQAMRRLRTPGEGPASEMARQLARGNFENANRNLEQMLEQIRAGDLSDEDKRRAAEQLEQLKAQLERLAERRDQLEEQLQAAGLSEAQARRAAADPDQLRQQLQQQVESGQMSEQQMQQLMQQAQAQQQASDTMSAMAQAMDQMAQGMQQPGRQLDQQAMQGAMSMSGTLSGLEMAQQELNALNAAMSQAQGQLDRLSAAMAEGGMSQCFGGGQGKGQGQIGRWAEGYALGSGGGSGGPGRGNGASPEAEPADFAWQKEKANVATKDGPIIASMMVQGSQIRGESSAEFGAVVSAATVEMAEAIETRRIPREHESAVQHYFGRLEAAANRGRGEPSEVAPGGSDADG